MLKAMMAAAGAMVMAAVLPASAQTVSTDQAAFDSIRNVTNYNFPFTGPATPADSYTQAGVTFTDPTGQYGVGAGIGFGAQPTSYLLETGQTTITFNGPVLGLLVASDAPMPLRYVFNGRAGSFIPGPSDRPSFIGFDTGSAAPVVLALGVGASEFEITGFQTALPEATTWAMMMAGLGVVGGALRRRRAVATGARFA